MKDFKNKTVIITGASSGIGRACAEEFAARGANIVLAARKYASLCELGVELEEKYQIKTKSIQCDVSKEEDCRNLIEQTLLEFSGIDVLINNAGISMRALFKDLDLQVLKTLMDVNFWGTVYCSKYAMSSLLASKGSLVGVSSIAGYRGLPGRTGYSASKFAMNGFMESLRVENLKTGLHVMLACPGFTASNIRNTALDTRGKQQGETNMDEGKMMSAEEVAQRIVDGVFKRKRSLIMTSQGKMAVFMNKFFPGWVDKQVFKLFAKEKNPLIK
ncbi:SDR family oxidoreductase [Albibacterium bauzanense]|uniref:Short-subunit dehydrogenase n=1 Tax=Albibacterium bauzanense TaxID=653929 RepID=A0A4V2PYA4_9SPHI|nr:SDR family oxidoreductase [Albibacterium bauzanense]TCK85221.1 short-subunit dehydrogenase [Albibacterium bauzanense]